jgi:endonuclease-3
MSAAVILKRLKKEYHWSGPFLKFENPLQSLVATILSAQCTDARVNMVTPALFKKYRKAEDFLTVPAGELEEDIRTTGFFRNKAKNIRGACEAIVQRFGGKVPATMDEMLTLPGVGRKTANCVLTQAHGVVAGVIVDTHVLRLSGRLGFSKETDAEKVEADLMKRFRKEDWYAVSTLLILHGRALCMARKPNCPECFLSDLCPWPGKTK